MAQSFLPVLNEVEKASIDERQPLPDRYRGLDDEEMDRRIAAAQRDARLAAAHPRPSLPARRGDQVRRLHRRLASSSRATARTRPDADFIVFCGVHFMAESADVLCAPHQKVILPDLAAGCSMADMADDRPARDLLARARGDGRRPRSIPVTYINSSAAIKAFVGEHGGIVCTSGNARARARVGVGAGERILFLPDQHLGRNTAYKMGVPLDQMVVWDPQRDRRRAGSRTRRSPRSCCCGRAIARSTSDSPCSRSRWFASSIPASA